MVRYAQRVPGLVSAVAFIMASLAGAAFWAEDAEAQAASQLRFILQPETVAVGETFSVRIGVYDAGGVTLVTAGSHTVTLTLQAAQAPATCPGTFAGAVRPCGALLQGTTPGQQAAITATTAGGLATFTGLRVDTAGIGYRLVASATGLTSATSAEFDATTGQAWMQPQRTAARTAAQSFPARMATPTPLADIGSTSNRPIVASPLVLDLDRDGLLDVVVAHDAVNTPMAAPVITAYRQTAPGSFASYWTYSGFPAFAAVRDAKAVIAAGNLDSDPTPEVVVYWSAASGFSTTQGIVNAGGGTVAGHDLRVLSGTTGTLLASWAPAGVLLNPMAPAIGDVTGDARPEIAVLNYDVGCCDPAANRLTILSFTGTSLNVVTSGRLPIVPYICLWAVIALSCSAAPFVGNFHSFARAAPVMAEMRSGHAGLEVLVGTNNLDHYDTVSWWFTPHQQSAAIFVCSPTTTSIGCNESTLTPSTPMQQGTLTAPHVMGLAAADLDGNGNLEVVATARYIDGTPSAVQDATFFALTNSLGLLGQGMDGYLWNPPAVGDMDGDGNADAATIQHGTDAQNIPRDGDVRVRGVAAGAVVDKGTLPRPAPAGQSSSESPGGGALVELGYVTGATPSLELVLGSEDRTLAAVTHSGGAPSLHWPSPVATPAVPLSPTVAADLNGDCAPEILAGMQNGNLRRVTGQAATVPGVVPTAAMAAPWTSPGPGLQANLHWTAPASDGGMPILSYRVMRATAPSGPFADVGVWRGATPPTPLAPYVDPVPATGDYYYVVRAVSCAGMGPAQANPFWAEVKPPAAPGSLVAHPHGLPAYAAATTPQVLLQWTASPANAPAPNGCGAPLGYHVYRAASTPVPRTPANRLTPTPIAATSYVDATAANQPYAYAVAALNCVGDAAAEVSVDLRLPDPPAPTLTPSGTTMVVSFPSPSSVPGCKDALRPGGWLEGFRIYRGTAPGTATYVGTLLPSGGVPAPPIPWRGAPPATFPGAFPVPAAYADQGLTAGTRYYYQVAAVSCVGEGPRSAEVSEVAGGSPPPLAVALSPANAAGKPAHTFTLTPSVAGGIPPYSCAWSVAPAGASLAPPTGSAACSGAATITGGTAGTSYIVTLQVTDGASLVGSGTATVAIAPPLAADIVVQQAFGSPSTVFSFAPRVEGGLLPYSCTWSITPLEGTFTVPSGAAACSEPATFTGGTVGTTYIVTLNAVDGVAPTETAWAYANVDVRENLPPVAAFVASGSAEPGQGLGFTDASHDPDGTIVAWLWDFGDGTTSTLRNPSHAFARGGTYHVRLVVFDDKRSSAEMVQAIEVGYADTLAEGVPSFGAAGPAVDAGPDLTVEEGSVVDLFAKGPADASYTWTQTQGPHVDLRNRHTASPAFTAPLVGDSPPLALGFSVVASQGGLDGPADTLQVLVKPSNRPPIVHAGEPQQVEAGSLVTLTGSATDPDGDTLSYEWAQVPGGVFVGPLDTKDATARFEAPSLEGELLFELRVSDGRTFAMDRVLVLVRPAPRLDASFTATPSPDDPRTVLFRASATAGEAVWDFGDGRNATGLAVSHTYDEARSYDATLVVKQDGKESRATQPVVVVEPKARLPASEAAAPSWLMVALGAGLFLAALGIAAVVISRRRRE